MSWRHDLGWQVGRGLHGTVEGVFGPADDARSSLDALFGWDTAEGVDEVLMPGNPVEHWCVRRNPRGQGCDG
jgi:hypothetical protein